VLSSYLSQSQKSQPICWLLSQFVILSVISITPLPYCVAVNYPDIVASFAAVRVLSCLRSPRLCCSCCDVVRLWRDLEACSVTMATVVVLYLVHFVCKVNMNTIPWSCQRCAVEQAVGDNSNCKIIQLTCSTYNTDPLLIVISGICCSCRLVVNWTFSFCRTVLLAYIHCVGNVNELVNNIAEGTRSWSLSFSSEPFVGWFRTHARPQCWLYAQQLVFIRGVMWRHDCRLEPTAWPRRFTLIFLFVGRLALVRGTTLRDLQYFWPDSSLCAALLPSRCDNRFRGSRVCSGSWTICCAAGTDLKGGFWPAIYCRACAW
jgi:hypothetical protein